MTQVEMSPAVVWALGVLAVASVLQIVALAVTAIRLFRTWSRLEAIGRRVAVDLGVVQRDLSVAARGFTAASSAVDAAVTRARDVASFAHKAAWIVAGVGRLGFGRAAAAWSLASILRQRG